jgi:hypothetical protein
LDPGASRGALPEVSASGADLSAQSRAASAAMDRYAAGDDAAFGDL